MRTIHIDPITRIEGHGQVVIDLDDQGAVSDAYFKTMEYRGFEKFCEGRMVWDMPSITSRICGFCPVSHHLASVKATEHLLGVQPPPTAVKLRELLHMGQIIQSHALHFFFCAMPDFLGQVEDVRQRSVFGMLKDHKGVADAAVQLRRMGQDIIDRVGGGRLHPVTCIPGGMTHPLEFVERVEMLRNLMDGERIAQWAVKSARDLATRNETMFDSFARFPSHYMGLVGPDNTFELYHGDVRVVGPEGAELLRFHPEEYLSHVEEEPDPRSWTKTTYLKGRGPSDGFYRVAAMARLNVAESMPTPLAQAELQTYRELGKGRMVHSSLYYHYARMIELLYAVEKATALLRDPEILDVEVRVPVTRRGGEGVGVLEAPRGTLFHHYWADDMGRITKVNLVVSTAHNKLAMDRSIRAVADSLVKGNTLREEKLNLVEIAIRCYDPCLSCSTHAWGSMPLEVTLRGPDGETLQSVHRGGASAPAERAP